ncbi:MAG: T9SS C-terminal target domain-containing protein [Bacteroidetes bacterium]|nr:MAG: T9SS C-terminal target domain-containing protein [Bacteroidota bacterium]
MPFANVSIDPTTGTVSITALPDSWGSQTFTITADDGQSEFNQATRTFSLNIQAVNDPPVFVLSGDLMLEENFVGTATVSATPGPVPADESSQGVTYSLDPPTVSFANVSIDPATGEVSVTALPDASGTQTFTVTANDGQSENNTFSQTFTLSIRAVNNPPTFSLSGDVIVEENFPTTERVQVTPDPVPADEQDQVVIYRLSPSSVPFANVHIDSLSGTILITAVQDSFGAQTFTVTADDGQAENNIATATFTLIVRSVNNAPTFSTSGDLLLEEDFSGTATVNVIPDPVPDNERDQQLRYSLNPASVGFAALTFNTFTGMVEVRALPDANGSQEFVITADDGQAENNLATDTFLLVVQPVNDVPAFVLDVNTLELEEDFEGTATVNALPEPVPADEQNQQVVYRLVPDSVPFARFDFDSTNGQLRISALPNAHGEASMMMIADDGQDSLNLDTARFVLRILSTNDPPTFSLSGDLTLPWNFPGTEEVILTPDPVPADEQDQQVSYSLEPANISFARLSFDSQTGRVSFMAEPDSFGSQVFTITANDGQDMNHTASASFTFTVLPPEPTSLRINCGADRDMAFGQYLFIADTFHFGGDVFYNPHIKDVLQTTWDELYRSERNAPSGVNTFEYDIPLRNGKYIVYLHFAETYWGAFGGGCCGNLGQRVFNVEVEGTPELVGFDILEHVGPMTALVQQVPVSIADGSLHLKFKALQDRPAIKAIEILTPADSATSISMIQNPNNPFVDPIYEFGTEPTPGDGNMLIYPNPVPDDMTILLENRMEGLLEVFVYDSFGKRYKEFTIDKKERYATFTLPVDDLIPGYYAIQVVDPNTGFSIARKFWKITR